jgi:hypothetical protein
MNILGFLMFDLEKQSKKSYTSLYIDFSFKIISVKAFSLPIKTFKIPKTPCKIFTFQTISLSIPGLSS